MKEEKKMKENDNISNNIIEMTESNVNINNGMKEDINREMKYQ